MVFISSAARFVSISYIVITVILIYFSLFSYFMGGKNPIIYTLKSYEIKKEIIGFKKFLETFSIIDKKSPNELKIWRIYLTYAMVLDVNKK